MKSVQWSAITDGPTEIMSYLLDESNWVSDFLCICLLVRLSIFFIIIPLFSYLKSHH